jgi:hypothetical protein
MNVSTVSRDELDVSDRRVMPQPVAAAGIPDFWGADSATANGFTSLLSRP